VLTELALMRTVLQVLSMSRLGGAVGMAPLVASMSSEVLERSMPLAAVQRSVACSFDQF
jgi:hypothetical protein